MRHAKRAARRLLPVVVWPLVLAGLAMPGRAQDEVRKEAPGGGQVVRWSSPRPVSAERRTTLRPAAAGASGTSTTFVPVTVPPVGRVPVDLAFTPNGAEVAIANRDSDNVTFLDVATATVKRTVAVGHSPVSLAVTPDGRYVLTADLLGNTVSAIDLASHTLAAKIPVTGQQPFRIRVTPDSRFAVVGLVNDAKTSALSVIDLDALHETASFPTPPQGVIGGIFFPGYGLAGEFFTRFTLTPEGSKIVLPSIAGAAVLVIDRATGQTLGTVPVAPQPWDVDVSSDGAFAIVGHEGGTGRITRVDLATMQATAMPLPLSPFFQINRITPDRRFAIVGGTDPATAREEAIFVDLQTGAVTSTVPARVANDITFTADGRLALVATYQSLFLDVAAQKVAFAAPVSFFTQLWVGAAGPGSTGVAATDSLAGERVFLFDLGGPAVALRAAVPSGEPPEGHVPRSIAISGDGSVAVVANRLSANVAVIDAATGTLRGLIDTGQMPIDVALTADGAWAAAVNHESNTLSVIDVAGLKVVAALPLAAYSDRVLLAPDCRTAYVFAEFPGSLSFVTLDGVHSRVEATLPTVERTDESGVGPFDSVSGVALSADGSVLAVCGTTPGQLQLIDAVARREIARVQVGTWPLRVALSADGSRAWVADSLSDDVKVVHRAAGGAAVQATVAVPRPYDLWLDPTGAFVYVVSASVDHPAVYVLDAAKHTVVKVVDVPSPAGFGLGASVLVPGLSMLYVGGAIDNPVRGALLRVALAGAGTQLADATPLSDYPANLAVSADGHTAVLSQVTLDGVDVVRFAPPVSCTASATQLCLRGNRFAVTAEWHTPQGQNGAGQALPLTAETGLFWFFGATNVELVVKVLDGCAVNGRYWVFAGGLTNVEVALHVTDTTTGAVRTYTNRLQTPYQPIQDTAAFATCP